MIPHDKRTILVIAPIVGVVVAYMAWELYKIETWPCDYRSAASLMAEYPSLNAIWNKKISYMDTREAAETILSAKLELAVKRGVMTEIEMMEREDKMFDITMKGVDNFDKKFQEECKVLTRTN